MRGAIAVSGLLAIITSSASSAAMAALNKCQDALVVATYRHFQSTDTDWHLATIVSENAYNEAKKSAGVNAVIYGIPVGASYDDFTRNLNKRLAQSTESLSTSQIESVLWTGLSGPSVAAYQACLQAEVMNSRGLHLQVKSASRSNITLTVSWNPRGSDPSKLPLTWNYLGTTVGLPESVTAGSNDVVVPRPSQEQTIAVNSNGFGDSVTIGPLPPPPPERNVPSQPRPVFKVRPTDQPPACDSAGSPTPQRVPTEVDGFYNLALLQVARAEASSLIPGHPNRHSISNLNDGWYNNCRSWIPNNMPAWGSIDLRANYPISSVAFGSEFQAFYRDRAATAFRISVATNEAPGTWIPVYISTSNEDVRNRREFPFAERTARFVRVDVAESTGGAVRIDEIEVYGRNEPN